MRSVHWFTVDETSAPRAASGRMRQASNPATKNSGNSDASGATH